MEATWIAAAFLLGLLFRELRLPPLVGFLAAGFGLHALGVPDSEALAHVAHVGVLLLLFTVGLKLRLQNLVRIEVWGTALAHLAVSGAVLAVLLHLLFGLPWPAALLVGIALGFSSTVVAAKVLEEKRELRAFHGRVAIGILIVQDLVAVALLGLSAGIAPSPWAGLLLVLLFTRPLLARLLERSGHEELLVLFGLLLALVAGGLAFAQVGLSSELGALLLGALLADHPRAHELGKALWSIKEVFLVAFFLRIGMAGLPGLEGVLLAAVLALVLVAKAAGFFWLFTRFKLRARTSFLAGMALASYSEFALIVAQIAVSAGLLAETWLVNLALTVALSFVVAAPLNRISHSLWEHRARRLLRPYEREQRHPDDAPISLGSARAVVVGMGRVGTGAYDQLRSTGHTVAGLDSDPAKVELHRAAGRRVLFADAEDPGLWERLRLEGVRAVLLAMPEMEARMLAAAALRRRGYRGRVSAIHAHAEEAQQLVDAGCDATFNYYDGAGAGFAEHTCVDLDDAQDSRSA